MRAFAAFLLAAVMPFCSALAQDVDVDSGASRPLRVGDSVTSSLGPDDLSRFHLVELEEGALLRAAVAQDGIMVAVEIVEPGGEEAQPYQSYPAPGDPAEVLFLARRSGAHRLVVRRHPWESPRATGSYTLRIRPPLSPSDFSASIAAIDSLPDPIRRHVGASDRYLHDTYRVSLGEGDTLRALLMEEGIELHAAILDPAGIETTRFETWNGRSGPEEIVYGTRTAGPHLVVVRRDVYEERTREGSYVLTLDGERADSLLGEWRDERRRMSAAATDWLRTHAVPIRTIDPSASDFEDLRPLGSWLEGARVVGLGEANHGTREFFQVKHRLFRFLVEELGFHVFAIEATLPESFAIDRYVRTGEGDPRKALAALYFWTWNTEEVLALIEWMRAYNADPGNERKVRFYGVDIQATPVAARRVREYLHAHAGDLAPHLEEYLERQSNPFLTIQHPRRDPSGEETRRALRAAAEEVRALVEAHGDPAGEEWELVHRYAEVLAHNVEFQTDRWFAARDSAMAANVAWILEREGEGARVALWAHNAHLARNGGVAMGGRLAKALGSEYVAVGLVHAEGSYHAVGRDLSLEVVDVPPPDPATHTGVLAATGYPHTVVNLRRLPEDGPAGRWFSQHRPMDRASGGTYLDLSEWFDVLVFIRESSPTRMLPTGRRRGVKALEVPSNLGFEETEEGRPVGWYSRDDLTAYDFETGTTDQGTYAGTRSAYVRRGPGPHYGGAHGDLYQELSADGLTGGEVRVNAALRARGLSDDGSAYLWVEAFRGHRVHDRSWAEVSEDSDWRREEVTLVVPEDSTHLRYGVALVGEGEVFVDDVEVDLSPVSGREPDDDAP